MRTKLKMNNLIPTVSVIIPAYNSEKFICESIESVLKQTFKHYEIIIIDDGSNDNTKNKIERFKESINYLYQNNLGPSVARNSGLKVARGQYIAFLDADDIWLPNKLELQVEFLDRNPDIGLVSCDALAFNEQNVLIASMSKERNLYSGWVFERLLRENFLNTDNVLIRKQVFKDVGMFNEVLKFCEDYDLWLRIANKYRIGYIDKILTKYRIHTSNRSGQNKKDVIFTHLNLMLKYLKESKISLLHKIYIISFAYYKAGYNLMAIDSKREARNKFIVSIIMNPFLNKAYLYLIGSFLPNILLNKIKKIKRILKPIRRS